MSEKGTADEASRSADKQQAGGLGMRAGQTLWEGRGGAGV